ncbi:hypothetical protein [Streptomyces xanthii]|uniref:Translation elongation factor EFG/EF2 domain-containing protein n=1 Tax=Streptomyces xanthii TaxID=2768069 RepID=A0A7H1B123_9ACTN|nr:hypothetical protein [Streptomyces xanthii]QNS02428.1 hypothetical protein IAG42_01560 [Streptomyces xanthii]
MTSDDTPPGAFPPRPLRDLRVVYARQAGCPADFAEIVVDFEPWEPGFVFEVHADLERRRPVPASELAVYAAAVEEGLRAELATLAPEFPAAVAVVLRAVRVHEVDSHAGAFRTAGRLAVRRALAEVHGPPRRPKRSGPAQR